MRAASAFLACWLGLQPGLAAAQSFRAPAAPLPAAPLSLALPSPGAPAAAAAPSLGAGLVELGALSDPRPLELRGLPGLRRAQLRRARASRAAPPAFRAAALPVFRRPLAPRVLDHARAQGFLLRAPELSPVPAGAAVPLAAPGGRSEASRGLRAVPDLPVLSLFRGGREEGDKPARRFLSSFLFIQLGVEGFALVAIQLTRSLSEGFMALSWISIASFGALAVGSLAAGPVVDRVGFKRSYVALQLGRAAASSAIAALYLTGNLGLGTLTALFSLDYLLLAGGRVAESVVPAALYGRRELPINRFGTWLEMLVGGVGFIAPLAAGYWIASQGFGPAVLAYPLLTAAGALLASTMRLPPSTAAVLALQRAAKPKGLRLGEAWRELRSQPLARGAVLPYVLAIFLTNMLYFMIGPAFGFMAGASPGQAATITGWFTGLYAAGGLLGTVILTRWNAKAGRSGTDAAGFLRATAAWLSAGALTLLGGWALLLGGLGAWPAYLFAVPFGMTAAGIFVQSETLIKSRVRGEAVGTVMGLIRGSMFLATTVGFLGLGLLFDRAPSGLAFGAVGALFTAAAAAYVWIARGIKKAADGLPPSAAKP